ncbi:22052_t:CDS:2 [Dentiscutata erythropus]|uniref:22052_t:CDS:1 n=1 Tax=Dentiscutata erythropus TaxID=1348616 RepID=A0A9N9A1K7_9GLOM|nr:22052_t:CDS:2 [Dentiscutata erythropus]
MTNITNLGLRNITMPQAPMGKSLLPLKYMAFSSSQFFPDNRQVRYQEIQEIDHMGFSYFQSFLENYQGQDNLGGYQVNNHITSLENQQKRSEETDIHSEAHQEGYQLLLEDYNEIIAHNAKSISLREKEFLLNERESQLNKRESRLNEKESQLTKKESQLKEEGSQHKTANAFLVYLRDILGNDFFLYHNKFLESLQNSSSFLETEEGKRKAAACDICRGRKKRCVGEDSEFITVVADENRRTVSLFSC